MSIFVNASVFAPECGPRSSQLAIDSRRCVDLRRDALVATTRDVMPSGAIRVGVHPSRRALVCATDVCERVRVLIRAALVV